MTPTNREQILCAALRRKAPERPGSADAESTAQFLEFGHHHGVLPLLDHLLRSRENLETWPEGIRLACRQATLAQTAFELAHGAELDRVLADLARARVTTLLLKGSGLAYSLYARPMLRPRSDSDLLVAPEMRDIACRILQQSGHRRVGGPAGKFVGYQLQLQRSDARGVAHNIDLHWRISDAQSFAWLFSFDDLAAAAVPVPSLSPHALRLGNAHALILSLLHRAANNVLQSPGFGDRLIWLYDIDLLVGAMSGAELEDFRAMVEAKRLGAIALQGLRKCAECFPSPALSSLIDTLDRSPHAQSGAAFLTAGRLQREWIEFRAIPGVRARLAYLAERAFPAPEYMREQYPESAARSLPMQYARRGWTGLARVVFRGRGK